MNKLTGLVGLVAAAVGLVFSSLPSWQNHGATEYRLMPALDSVALASTEGETWAWGWNANGQLGNGSKTSSNVPTQVSDISGSVALAGGNIHSLEALASRVTAVGH